MKIVSATEMREIDRVTTEKFGVPSLALMENAGASVVEHVPVTRGESVTVFCGKGNNGGDGFVVARLLHQQSKHVQVVLLADPADLKGDAAVMYGKMPLPAIIIRSTKELKGKMPQLSADIYVDAILGTGFKPPVTGLYAEVISIINQREGKVIAVDIPSGADADAMSAQQGLVMRADAIVTFTAPRPAHVFSLTAKAPTYVASIGSPPEAIVSSLHMNVIHPRDYADFMAPRPPESNKGNYGHVLVIGGSVGKAGSVAMAGMAALRSGAGLATVATAKSALPTVAGFHPELMTEPLPETDVGTIATSAGVRIEELLKSMTVVAIGPGISRDPHTATFVRSLVAHHNVPMVVDADALNALEGHTGELNGKRRVLVITPHPGEMARLCNCSVADVQKNRLGTARKFASDHELIVVLKGHRTLVVEPNGEAWVNTSGNPGMATGGTGDILTGMIAGMLAQEKRSQDLQKVIRAVCAAVHLHGCAGDEARQRVGEQALVATDLLAGLPFVIGRACAIAQNKSVRWQEL